MKLVTTEQMRTLEKQAFAAGTSEAALMERAGAAVAEAAARWLAGRRAMRVLVLVGKGNNGGDALIAARVLRETYGAEPRLYLCAGRPPSDPLLSWARDAGMPIFVHEQAPPEQLVAQLAAAEVVLDGVLGIGGRLPLRGPVAEVLRAAGETQPPGQRRIAVDVPTGVQSDTGQVDDHAFRAHVTFTTGPAKPGLFIAPGARFAGRVLPVDVGLYSPDDHPLERAGDGDVARLLPPRSDDAHKGTYGKVLVIAGSAQYVGAAYLAGAAAVRAGAGLVTLAVPARVQAALAGRSVETTYLPLPDDREAPGCLTPGHLGSLLDAARGYEAVALGPGLGSDAATRRLVLLLAERLAEPDDWPPVLIDADGLNALAASGDWPRPAEARWVLTPHPGEMSRLSGLPTAEIQRDRLRVALEHAAKWGQVVVLKGAPSIVAAPDGRATLGAHANGALATAGSGDVLTGLTVGLLAQGCPPFAAAVAGCYVHGLAGELWRARHGAAGLAVSDLLPEIPNALRYLRALA